MTPKQRAGQLGGLAVFRRYGSEHMRRIGQQGARVFWTRYQLQPVDVAAFAIVERATGRVVAFTPYDPGR